MGRPIKKSNFGNVNSVGERIALIADIGDGAEQCWIESQKGVGKFIVKSVEGGATPARSGVVKLQEAAPTAEGQGQLDVYPNGLGGSGGGAELSLTSIRVVSGTVVSGGTGYIVGEEITLAGGTGTTDAILVVASETGGAIDTVTVKASFAGVYTVLPTSTDAHGVTTGGGGGATFTLDGGIEVIAIDGGGADYTASAAVNVHGVAADTIAVTVTAGVVDGITYTARGTGVTDVSNVQIEVEGVGAEQVRNLTQHHAKTFQGNSWKWVLGTATTEAGEGFVQSVNLSD